MKQKNSSLIIGIIFILFGLNTILTTFGMTGFQVSDVQIYVITGILSSAIGILMFSNNSRFLSFCFIYGGILLILSGVASRFYALQFTPEELLPAVLFTALGSMFVSKFLRSKKLNQNYRNVNYSYTQDSSTGYNSSEKNDFFEINDSFSSSIHYINSDRLRGGSINTRFGESKVYFQNVKLEKNDVTITINQSFSSLDLHIPRNFVVNYVGVSNRLSNISVSGFTQTKEDAPMIYLTGACRLTSLNIIFD